MRQNDTINRLKGRVGRIYIDCCQFLATRKTISVLGGRQFFQRSRKRNCRQIQSTLYSVGTHANHTFRNCIVSVWLCNGIACQIFLRAVHFIKYAAISRIFGIACCNLNFLERLHLAESTALDISYSSWYLYALDMSNLESICTNRRYRSRNNNRSCMWHCTVVVNSRNIEFVLISRIVLYLGRNFYLTCLRR